MTEPPRVSRREDAHRYVVDAVADLVTSDDWIAMLRSARQFRDYSPRNTLLLALQGAQGRVAGYRAWQSIPSSDGGYCQVRQGARALKILAPILRRDVVTDRAPADEPRVRRLDGWRVVSVFDERSLIAAPEPSAVLPMLLDGAAPQGVWDALAAQVTLSGYSLVGRDVSPANGVTDYRARVVAVRSDLPELQRVKTLAHELAHVTMHGPDTRPERMDRAVAEVEAESVAFVVLADLGVDASAYTLPYVAHWADGDPELVASTATRVIATARTISDSIEQTIRSGQAMTVTDETESSGPAWTVTTSSGVWTIGYDTNVNSLVARHDIDGAANIAAGNDFALTSVGMLESTLGFAIPQEIADDLRALQLPHHRSADTQVEPLDLTPSERPTLRSVVRGPDGEIGPYGSLLERELIDRSWSDGELTVETWALDGDRAAFRVSSDARLVTAGEILLGGVDAASDDALRSVAAACATRPAFDDDTRSKLLSVAAVPSQPFEPGTRVAVSTRRGEAPVLGSVLSVLVDERGELSGYEWRPDVASLVGHPWHEFTHSTTASKDRVAATLLPVDRGLPGPDAPLAFGASIRVGDEDATVLRGYDASGATFSYDVVPADGGEVRRITAEEISAVVAGTAWPDAAALIAEREHRGIAMVPGERLTTTHGTVWIDATGTPSPTPETTVPPPPLDTRARREMSRVGVDDREPSPSVVTVDLHDDVARVGDPRHGWLTIARQTLMRALADPPEVLAARLRAAGTTRVDLDGHESHVTLAALAAKHLDVAPAADSPSPVTAPSATRQATAELTL